MKTERNETNAPQPNEIAHMSFSSVFFGTLHLLCGIQRIPFAITIIAFEPILTILWMQTIPNTQRTKLHIIANHYVCFRPRKKAHSHTHT